MPSNEQMNLEVEKPAVETAPKNIETELGSQADAYVIRGNGISVEKLVQQQAQKEEAIEKAKEEVQGFFSKLKSKFSSALEKKPLTEEAAIGKMNPAIRASYEKMKQTDPERAEKYLKAIQKNHDTNVRWDGNNYVSGRYGSSSGDLGGNYGG